jgi:2-keto-4-pentenoate hydratase/2-oxohepta-3-ene-1,7-dioic acid hydratase in catechol pathway
VLAQECLYDMLFPALMRMTVLPGPGLTTADAVPDARALSILMRVNGQVAQNSKYFQSYLRIPRLMAFISAAIALEPGDIIATGTPDAVGVFRKPPVLLKAAT